MYNGHIHIFNSKCAPDDFLKVGLPGKLLDGLADELKYVLESDRGRKIVKFFVGRGGNKRRLNRTIAFFDIGVEASQRNVFERIQRIYDGHHAKYFVLTLNMDYMTTARSEHINYETQLAEVFEIKQTYPDQLLVFLSCDPRHLKGKQLADWFKRYYEEGKVVGIKLYPALGFFPFDPAFEELFAYANKHKIPVLTHTTRTGSFYIGNNVRELVGAKPASFDPKNSIMNSIYARIAKYNGSTHRKLKLNDYYCNIFSHPENYIPLIEKFPNLKLCFAHYGGTNEVLRKTDEFMLDLENDPNMNWTDLIADYMKKYDNVYTDISYTLAEPKTHKRILEDMKNPHLNSKIIFGTDYFMDEQENSETKVFADFRASFLGETEAYRRLTVDNPKKFLYE